jgi:hypothetical protein
MDLLLVYTTIYSGIHAGESTPSRAKQRPFPTTSRRVSRPGNTLSCPITLPHLSDTLLLFTRNLHPACPTTKSDDDDDKLTSAPVTQGDKPLSELVTASIPKSTSFYSELRTFRETGDWQLETAFCLSLITRHFSCAVPADRNLCSLARFTVNVDGRING